MYSCVILHCRKCVILHKNISRNNDGDRDMTVLVVNGFLNSNHIFKPALPDFLGGATGIEWMRCDSKKLVLCLISSLV